MRGDDAIWTGDTPGSKRTREIGRRGYLAEGGTLFKKTSCALRRGGTNFRCPKSCRVSRLSWHFFSVQSYTSPIRLIPMDRRGVGVGDEAHATTGLVLV